MRRFLRWASLVLLVVILLGVVATALKLNSVSETISGKGLLTSDIARRSQGPGRFNLLVLGYGGGQHDGAYLTDSILVYSVPTNGGAASQVSVPRDLWVQYPQDSGQYHKINAVYAYELAATNSPTKAAQAAETAVGQALGIPIDGWMTVDFNGFRDIVNALGGVTVDVQRSFTAKYPRNDDAAKDYHWITVSFKKGPQTMDGETAIRYARARYSTDPVEGSDFGRAARQQRLVAAIKAKLLSPAGVLRSWSVMDAAGKSVRTDVSAGDLVRLFRHKVDTDHDVVLSTSNVLVSGTSSDGQYILLPRGGDWIVVSQFVRNAISGEHTAAR